MARKFKGGKSDKGTIKLGYLGEELTSGKLSEMVATHNSKHPAEFAIRVKGSSNLEIPSALMVSFFQPLFENIKTKVTRYISMV